MCTAPCGRPHTSPHVPPFLLTQNLLASAQRLSFLRSAQYDIIKSVKKGLKGLQILSVLICTVVVLIISFFDIVFQDMITKHRGFCWCSECNMLLCPLLYPDGQYCDWIKVFMTIKYNSERETHYSFDNIQWFGRCPLLHKIDNKCMHYIKFC